MASKAYQSYIFKRFELIFKSEDNKEVIENIPVRILTPFSSKIKEIENLDQLPNLLGLDFLELGYKLFCDLKKEITYLESPD